MTHRIVRGEIYPDVNLSGVVDFALEHLCNLPQDIPHAVIKEAKARRTGKAPTAQIYLPIEYAGMHVLVIPISRMGEANLGITEKHIDKILQEE